MQYLKQKPYNFTTNMLNAYLSPQPSSLSAFMIIKTHIAAQKSHRRQLAKCACGNESAIFLILLSFFLLRSTTITQDWFKYSPWFQHKTASYISVQIHEHLASVFIVITSTEPKSSSSSTRQLLSVAQKLPPTPTSCANHVLFVEQSPDTAMLFAPFLLTQNLSPKDIARSDIIKQKVS